MANTELFTLGQTIPAKVLKKDYVKVEDKPFGQAALAYSLVLPNDWIQLKLSAPDGQLLVEHPKLLSTFLGPKQPEGNPMAQVWCQGLVREISAGDWLKDFLSRSNASIIALEVRSPYLAEALALRQEGAVAIKTRISARLAGNRLFLVQGVAPEPLFPAYAEAFGLAISSFKPALLSDNPHVELWQTHHLDQAVTFNAPYSWLERRPKAPAGLDLVDLYNLNASAQPVAILKVMSVRRTLTQGKKGLDLPALLIAEFTKAGLQVTEVAAQETVSVPKPLSNGSLRVCKAIVPKSKDHRLQNLLVVAVDGPSHHVLAGLQTCAPNEGFYEYAMNRRAFDIVLDTLKCGVQAEQSGKDRPRAEKESTKPSGKKDAGKRHHHRR
jgi:hypothetical protein